MSLADDRIFHNPQYRATTSIEATFFFFTKIQNLSSSLLPSHSSCLELALVVVACLSRYEGLEGTSKPSRSICSTQWILSFSRG